MAPRPSRSLPRYPIRCRAILNERLGAIVINHLDLELILKSVEPDHDDTIDEANGGLIEVDPGRGGDHLHRNAQPVRMEKIVTGLVIRFGEPQPR